MCLATLHRWACGHTTPTRGYIRCNRSVEKHTRPSLCPNYSQRTVDQPRICGIVISDPCKTCRANGYVGRTGEYRMTRGGQKVYCDEDFEEWQRAEDEEVQRQRIDEWRLGVGSPEMKRVKKEEDEEERIKKEEGEEN